MVLLNELVLGAVSFGGRYTDTSCAGIRSALQALTESDALGVEWDGQTTTLSRYKPVENHTEPGHDKNPSDGFP